MTEEKHNRHLSSQQLTHSAHVDPHINADENLEYPSNIFHKPFIVRLTARMT